MTTPPIGRNPAALPNKDLIALKKKKDDEARAVAEREKLAEATGLDVAAVEAVEGVARQIADQGFDPAPRAVQPPTGPATEAPSQVEPEERGFLDRVIEGASNIGGAIVDGMEAAATAPTDLLAHVTRDIPIIGPLASGLAWGADQAAGFVGGVLRGAGNMVEGVAQAIAHPVDTARGLWAVAGHIPMFPANPVRMINAGWDIAVNGAPVGETLRNNLDPRITLREDAQFAGAMASAYVAPIREAWKQGNYGEAFGRAAFEVVSMVGSGGATAAAEGTAVASRAARVARYAGRAAEIGGHLADVADVAQMGETAQNDENKRRVRGEA